MRPLPLLVTDDDLDKRFLISRAVSREFPNASIFECKSGQEALEFVANNQVDAIITNHNMAPVNGLELAQRLRAAGVKLPIIMVSGHDEVRKSAVASGVDLFLSSASTDLGSIGRPIADFLRNRGIIDREETSRTP